MKYTLNPKEYYKINSQNGYVLYEKVKSKEEILKGGTFLNKYYDKSILLAYTYSSGGNFLINCLSLSDDVCSSFNSIEDKKKIFMNI